MKGPAKLIPVLAGVVIGVGIGVCIRLPDSEPLDISDSARQPAAEPNKDAGGSEKPMTGKIGDFTVAYPSSWSQGPPPHYFVAYRDGLLNWSVSEDSISMSVGLWQTVFFGFDAETRALERIGITLGSDADSSVNIIDTNADGIPDLRVRTGTGQHESEADAFFEGEFVPSVAVESGRRITKGGETLSVEFREGKWQRVKETEVPSP